MSSLPPPEAFYEHLRSMGHCKPEVMQDELAAVFSLTDRQAAKVISDFRDMEILPLGGINTAHHEEQT